MLSVKRGGIKNHFWDFGMTRPGIVLYSHEHDLLYKHIYTHICWIHRDAMNKDERRLLKNISLTLLSGLCGRGSWRLNKDCNLLTPTLMAITVVLFSFSWCSTGGPGPTLLAFSTVSYHQLVWSPNAIGGPEGPFCWVVAYPTTSCLQLVWSQTLLEAPRALSAERWLSLPHLLSYFSGPQLTDFRVI